MAINNPNKEHPMSDKDCVCNNGHYVFSSFWKENQYRLVQSVGEDNQFFNAALKSAHIEGKMSAREMTHMRGLTSPVGNVAPV